MKSVTEVAARTNPGRRAGDPEHEPDELRLRLLGAVDAARGAEAERAVLEARVRELEHQHHMLEVERDELRREVDRLSDRNRRSSRRVIGRVLRAARRRLGNG